MTNEAEVQRHEIYPLQVNMGSNDINIKKTTQESQHADRFKQEINGKIENVTESAEFNEAMIFDR